MLDAARRFEENCREGANMVGGGGQGRHLYSRGWHPRHKNVPVDSLTRSR